MGDAAARPFVSGVVLAAGESLRFGSTKQLHEISGRPMVRRAVETALAAQLDEVVVVLGHRAPEVAVALAGLPVSTVVNDQYREGLASSVRCGLSQVAPQAAAALFLPADQPGLDAATLDCLLDAWRRDQASIVVPVYRGRRGAPVVFARRHFAELARLEGDVGGRQLIEARSAEVAEVEIAQPGALLDVDSPRDLPEDLD